MGSSVQWRWEKGSERDRWLASVEAFCPKQFNLRTGSPGGEEEEAPKYQ